MTRSTTLVLRVAGIAVVVGAAIAVLSPEPAPPAAPPPAAPPPARLIGGGGTITVKGHVTIRNAVVENANINGCLVNSDGGEVDVRCPDGGTILR